MRRNSLRTATVIALFVNAIGMGWVPPSAAGAPVRDYDPASVGALPAWFAAVPDDQHPVADQETYTDSAGWYRFGGLAHGTHKVTLDPATLPPRLRPVEGEPVPALWLTPGMERISDPLSTGVCFTAAYERKNSTITGLVFVDRDGDGRPGPGEPGIPGVRVIDPTVHQYYVPFNDANLWTLFDDKNRGLPGVQQCHTTGTSVAGTLNSSIFLIASSDGTVFYYDHWEDGYDLDPLVPGPTTEAGMLDAGAFRIFEDSINPAQVPDTSVFFYDGRDRITIVGEEASVVRQAYPSTPGTLLAAAWEIPEVADWGDSFVATVGEDLAFNAGAVQDHDFTGLEVMAALPGTQVYYNGALVATLGFTDTVFIDGANDGADGGGVDSTDTITATGPIQVQMMTGGCGDYFSAHGYTLQPVNAWCDLYLAPVPGFERGCNPRYPTGSYSNADTDIYLHNPHPDPITVTVSSQVVTSDIVIPSNTTMSVLYATGWPDIATGIHGTSLTSSQDFWGMAVIDSSTNGTRQSEMFDWGYALVPGSDLSSQVVVGYAPGNRFEPPTDNGNLAFVTAVTDTVIYVDLNQDGLPDPIDMNGDGDRDDYDVLGVGEWDEPTSALGIKVRNRQVLRVGDPYDHNLMGAMIYTLNLEQKIAVAWGQDPCWATIADPYLDLGYTVLPFAIPRLSKTDQLAVDADLTGAVSPGDTITYTLALYNNGTGPMNDVVLTDPLPYTYTDFVTGSVQVTTPPPVGAIEYSNDGVNFGDPQGPRIQAFRITWPRIEPGQTVTSVFRVRLHTDIPVDVDEISNQAVVVSSETEPRLSEDPDDPTDPDTDTPVARPLLSIDKRVSPLTVQPGGRITYTIVVSNYGNGVALLTAITDVLPSWVRYVTGTLDLAWPIAQVDIATRTVTDTQSFHGHYADDFDLSPTETTYYAGDDGSLPWSTDWTEVNDDIPSDPASGEVRVLTDTNALSAPAHLWMEDADGTDAGVQRALDLSEFQAPWLRYHVSGTTSLAGDDAYTVLSGTTVLTQAVHNGEYAVREIDLSAAAGNPAVNLSLLATGGLDPGEYYRFDHISVYETEPLREVTRTLTSESIVLSYTTSTDGDPASYDPLTGYMVITEGMRLAAGGFITVTFQAQVQSPLTDDLTLANTACVTAPNWLEILSPPCDDAAVQVQSGHALTITKTAVPSPVAMGGLLTYTLHYTITGNEAVESMVVSDTTPVSTTFYAAMPTATPMATLISSPTVGTRGPVIWRVSGLWPPGSGIAQRTGTLRMVVLLDSPLLSGTLIYNAVTISDTTNLTDTDEITTPVTSAADLAIFKSDEPDPVIPGEFLTYTLEVVNNGPNEAENVVVTDTLPPEVSFVTATVPVTVALPDLVWPLGRMAFSEVRRLTVTVQVGLDVTQTFTNTASVDSTTPDPRPNNNDADEDTSPPLPGLELVKTVEPYHAARGMPFTYRLRITNTGDFAFTALRLEDHLDDRGDFHYIIGSGSPTDPDPPIVEPDLVWSNLGPLGINDSITVSYQVTTTTAANDTYTNTATVEGTYSGGTLTDTDDAVVEIADPAVAVDKRLVKQDTDLLYPNYVTFTIAITNVGPSTIDVLPLLDTYDTNYLKFKDATPYPEEEDANNGILTWHDLTGPAPHGFDRNLPPGEAFVVTTVFLIVRDVFVTTNTAIVTGATDVYGNPADEVQDDECIRDAPTPIELLYFRAVAEEAAVRLEWKTGAEVDCLGFYLYRAPDAHFSHAEAIAYHAAQGGNSIYSHLDRDVTPGQVYWYWLVEVNTDRPDLERPYGPVWGGVELDALPFRIYLPLIQRSW